MALLPSDPNQQRKLLIGLIPLLLAFAYWYFVHPDMSAEVQAKQTRLERLETQNSRARVEARDAGPELEARVARYQEQIDRLEQLIPRTDEVPQLLNDMSLRAQEASVDLVRLAPVASDPGEHYRRESFEVRVAGAYHDVGRFLAAIGSLPRIVTPVDLNLGEPRRRDRNEDGLTRDGAKKVEATFRIRTYVLPGLDEEVLPDART